MYILFLDTLVSKTPQHELCFTQTYVKSPLKMRFRELIDNKADQIGFRNRYIPIRSLIFLNCSLK